MIIYNQELFTCSDTMQNGNMQALITLFCTLNQLKLEPLLDGHSSQ